MNLLQLLKSLQRQQRGLAIVLDEFRGQRASTMQDILEQMSKGEKFAAMRVRRRVL